MADAWGISRGWLGVAVLVAAFSVPAVAHAGIPAYKLSFGSSGAGSSQFNHPADVAIDSEGSVWVVDQNNDRIEKFNGAGEFLDEFGSSGSASGHFGRPTSIALDGEGNLWIADAGNSRVMQFNPEGELLLEFGSFGSGSGKFNGPEGIAVDGSGNVWVADTYNGRVQEFDETGEFIRVVGSYGSGEGQLGEPTSIDIGLGGSAFVADWQNNRVTVFNETGGFVREFGTSGSGNGQFGHPDAIEVDAGGTVSVGDEQHSRIEQFDEAGEYLGQFGSGGSSEGQFNFGYPFGLTTDEVGQVWIADSLNDRVQMWSDDPKPVCQEGSVAIGVDETLELESGALECEGEEPLEYEVVSSPSHGEITAFDPETGALTYVPDLGFAGVDTFTFRASNELGTSAATTFRIQVGEAPIAAYSFDEGEGETAHDLVGNHDGTIEGAEWTASGKYGSALVFDGGASVTIPDAGDLDLTNEFTLEAWVRPHFPTRGATIFVKEDSANRHFGYQLNAEAFGEDLPVAFLAGGGFSESVIESETPAPSNEWSHVTLTSTGSQAKLYVNGELAATHAAVPVRATNGPLRIGGEEWFGEYFDGRIDEVRIYGQVLTKEEIERDRDTPLEAPLPPASGPVAAFPFDEGEGEVAHDVARENDGEIEGAEWVAGKYGRALHFDSGSEDSVAIPADPALDLHEAFTLEAWVRPDASTPQQPVISKQGEAGESYALFGAGEIAGTPEGLVVDEEENSYPAPAEEAIPNEAWSHLALTSDGEEMRIYINGELANSAPVAGARLTEGALRIGGDPGLERFFNGAIDEVRIYDRQLSEEEIVKDRDESFGGPELTLGGALFEGSPAAVVSPDLPLTVDIHDRGSKVAFIELLIDGEPERSITREEMLADGGTQTCSEGNCHLVYSFTAAAADDTPGGSHGVGVVVVDENGQRTTREKTVTFDVEPPELSLGGELWQADGGSLEEEEANLEVEAEDRHGGDTGIEEIRIAVDGEIVLVEHFPCEPACEESESAEFLYKKTEWGEGPHKVEVTALDGAGNESAEFLLVDASPVSVEPECTGVGPSSLEAAGIVTTAQAQERLEEVLPGAIEENLPEEEEPELFLYPFWQPGQPETPSAAYFRARDAFTSGLLAKEAAGAFTIGSAACLAPTATTSAETAAFRPSMMLPTVIHANSAPETDTAIRVTSLGGAIIDSFRGEEAPSTLSWRAALAEDEEFQELPDGSVALVKPAGVDIEPNEVPSFPSAAANPENLADTRLQAEASISEVAMANSEIEGQVMAVLAPPVLVDAEGNRTEGELTVSGGVISAARPAGAVAMVIRASSAPNPVAICARTASRYPTVFAETCGPEEAGDSGFVPSFDWLGESKFVYALETFDSTGAEGALASSRLYTANADGTEPVAITPPDYLYFDPQSSPDGSKIVATRCDLDETHCAIHIMDSDGSNDELVTEDASTGRGYFPTFGANAEEIYFFRALPTGAHEEAVDRQLFYVDSAGTNERQVTDVLNPEPCPDEPPCNLGLADSSSPSSISPDGEKAVFVYHGKIWQVDTEAEGASLEELSLLTEFEGEEEAGWPSYSPDGEKILFYYEASPSGSPEDGLYTMNPNGSGKAQLMPYEAGTGETRYASFDLNEEAIAYLHQGLLYAVDNEGEGEHLVSDGDEPLSLTQAVIASGDAVTTEAAEAAEEQIQELEGEISVPPASFGRGPSFRVSDPSEGSLDPNDAEIAFCINNLYNAVECVYFKEDRDTSIEKRHELFTARYQIDRSTRGNAFQHGFWTALMVRHGLTVGSIPDGLVFALLHEGDAPYSWDSRMDVLNDFVGYRYAIFHNPDDDWKICEGLRIKSRRDIFMGKHIAPQRWAAIHNFHYEHLVFRFFRANTGKGPVVKLNGRVCEPGSPT
jgi:DNA-binding beta-propeller fold protein YncE